MAEIKSFPNNQDEYQGAEWLMRWHHGRTSGVFGADEKAAVKAVPEAMAVTVSDGLGWLSNAEGNGIVWWVDHEKVDGIPLQLAIPTADSVLGRIDRVVISWQTTNYVARPEVEILKGTPSAAPVPPALTNSSTLRQISLARINVPAGTLKITPDLVTDERLDPEVCGLVTESVTADTSVINAQFADLLEQLESAIAQAWEGEISDGAISEEKLSESFVLPIEKGGTGETTLDGIKAVLGLENMGVQIVKIWENGDVGSSFGELEITTDAAAGYDLFYPLFRLSSSSGVLVPSTFGVVDGTGAWGLGISSGYFARRQITVKSTKITFATARRYGTYGNSDTTEINNALIPVCIYGIKGVK